MAELRIRLSHIRENIEMLDHFFHQRKLTWTLVMKVLAGYTDYLAPILQGLDLKSMVGVADSRLTHLVHLKKMMPRLSTWQIRPPVLQNVDLVAEFVDVSCNSSIDTLTALNKAAKRKGKSHQVIIMVELGENREGVLQSELPDFFDKAINLSHLKILGLGANLGCLHGVEPTYEILIQLLEYKKTFENQYGINLPLISGGSSVNLPLIEENTLPPEINHYRIGEAAFFGTTPYNGLVFGALNTDNFTFHTSVLEVYSKDMEPTEALVPSAVGDTFVPPLMTQDGLQAILDFGLLDVDSKNLKPWNPNQTILGSTSDMTTLYAPEGKVKVGDDLVFIPDYMGVAKLMVSGTIKKSFTDEAAF